MKSFIDYLLWGCMIALAITTIIGIITYNPTPKKKGGPDDVEDLNSH